MASQSSVLVLCDRQEQPALIELGLSRVGLRNKLERYSDLIKGDTQGSRA